MNPADHILLTRDVLDVGAISALVSSESCGAICLFVGTTRDNFNGKRVVSLEYEAYEPMAMKEMRTICTELRTHWADVVNVAFYHRLGLVPVKEASIVIAVTSPHRQSALDAIAYAVAQLKKRVPIWKKEKYDNDESEWKENAESKQMVGKRPKLDFEVCEVQDQSIGSKSLVQISAGESEIQRRIHCFIDKKREEIDINNVMDFTSSKQMQATGDHEYEEHDVSTSTCARTSSVIVKQEHSKGHLKVRRVENRIGPQTGPYYWEALDKLMSTDTKRYVINTKNECVTKKSSQLQLPTALQERLVAVEKHIHLSPADSEHIYARLKSIENRILYLESISPEYRHFMTGAGDWISSEEQQNLKTRGPLQYSVNRKTYTADELSTIIAQMQTPNESDKREDTNY